MVNLVKNWWMTRRYRIRLMCSGGLIKFVNTKIERQDKIKTRISSNLRMIGNKGLVKNK